MFERQKPRPGRGRRGGYCGVLALAERKTPRILRGVLGRDSVDCHSCFDQVVLNLEEK